MLMPVWVSMESCWNVRVNDYQPKSIPAEAFRESYRPMNLEGARKSSAVINFGFSKMNIMAMAFFIIKSFILSKKITKFSAQKGGLRMWIKFFVDCESKILHWSSSHEVCSVVLIGQMAHTHLIHRDCACLKGFFLPRTLFYWKRCRVWSRTTKFCSLFCRLETRSKVVVTNHW